MPQETKLDVVLNCPVPIAATESILLGHGSGGRMSAKLLREILLPALQNPVLDRLDDQAIVDVGGSRIAFSTDTFVVKPLFFPGGDIGTLAVNGTVNDLAMGGAKPLFLSLALILEEGLPIDTLRRVMESIRVASALAGVVVVTGDTKVVEKGSGDGLFVNTSGIGLVSSGVRLSADRARPGDLRAVERDHRRTRDHDSVPTGRPGIRKRGSQRHGSAARSGSRYASGERRYPLSTGSDAGRTVEFAE